MKYANSKWPFYGIRSKPEFLETQQQIEELTNSELSLKNPQNQSFGF